MENAELKKIIQKSIEDLVAGMGFDCEVETVFDEEGGAWQSNIKTAESNFLIGQYGVNLESLQHIARVIIRKKTDERLNFTLDVNRYRQEKTDSIVKVAQDMATLALNEGRAVVLRPMSAYERRIVHLEMTKNDKVKTESIGEGEDRRVVIKPADIL